MSRAYRIRVSESLSRSLAAEDEICSHLELLEVLPPEQMTELLREELKQRGFLEKDGLLRRTDDGVTIEIDPAYVDVTVLRWQDFTGAQATHADGRSFAAVAAERAKPAIAATETV